MRRHLGVMITLAASDCCPGSFGRSWRAVRARLFDRDIAARLADLVRYKLPFGHAPVMPEVGCSIVKTGTVSIAGRTQRGRWVPRRLFRSRSRSGSWNRHSGRSPRVRPLAGPRTGSAQSRNSWPVDVTGFPPSRRLRGNDVKRGWRRPAAACLRPLWRRLVERREQW